MFYNFLPFMICLNIYFSLLVKLLTCQKSFLFLKVLVRRIQPVNVIFWVFFYSIYNLFWCWLSAPVHFGCATTAWVLLICRRWILRQLVSLFLQCKSEHHEIVQLLWKMVPQKNETGLPCDAVILLLCLYPKEFKAGIWTHICIYVL